MSRCINVAYSATGCGARGRPADSSLRLTFAAPLRMHHNAGLKA